ncbi:MAG: sigma-54 dependent transcriptional regulator [Polyangiaceae bacterium]
MATVLVVEDDRSIRRSLEKFIQDLGHEVVGAGDGQAGLERLRQGGIDLCLLDMGLPLLDGMGVLRALKEEAGHESSSDRATVVVVSARDDMRSTIEAVKAGAYDYLLKPIDLDRLELTLKRALEQRAQSHVIAHYVAAEKESFNSTQIVGRSESIREVFKAIGSVASSRATVLIRGESGTGKELVARAIHHASSEASQPFVAANCTAFARDLLESELFGHVKGAFTGAVADKVGRLQLAGKGTLFLDEIGELPLDLQAKLLRVLQERVYERVGDSKPQKLEARIIAATHRDLASMVKEGTLREDLYYRLRVVEVTLPPLRERREDIPLLVEHLLARINRELHTNVHYVHQDAMDRLISYDWPGNIRELENTLTRAIVLAKGESLTAANIPLSLSPIRPSGDLLSTPSADPSVGADGPLPTLRDVEKAHIVRVLMHTGWNKRRSCGILKITRPTLDRKIKEFKLVRPPEFARGGHRSPSVGAAHASTSMTNGPSTV